MEDDGDDKEDSKRKSRNLSEKKRRDQFNMLVNELSSMVSTNTRKMDKSTVLKSTISFLKNHQEITVRSRVNEIQENWKPSFLSNEEFTHLILEALDGFIIVFSSAGMILYTSESITSLLGLLPNEIVNSSLYNLTYDDDRPMLYSILQNAEDKWDELQDDNFRGNQVTFSCHLKRNCLDINDDQFFDLVEFIGYFRKYSVPQSPMDNPNVPYRFNNTDVRIIFVCTGRLRVPQLIREMPVLDFSNSEFTSRHSLEWKFLFLDHRAPPIIGYLPFEVLGTSGYDYYHFDDLDNVISCHEALMQKGEGTSCYYRFLTKGQQWIWLQTRFYITYHQWNSKPEFVVCTHKVVSCVDVIKNSKNECTPLTQIDDFTSDTDKKTLIYNQENSSLLPKSMSFSQSSNWSRNSNSSSRYNANDLTNVKRKYRQSSVLSPGQTSDTGSMSAESIISKQSTNTHGSSHSTYSRKDHTNTSIINSYPQSQYQLENVHQPSQYSHPPQQNLLLHAPVHNSQYIDPSQYVAVPVQPVIGFPQIQGIPTSPDMSILITPAQAQIQEQLQKKHEELQQMIIQQQEELRRVSEQLVMARYGLLPPIINVPVPFSSQGSPGTPSASTHVYTSGMPGIMPRPVMEPVVPSENNEYIPMQMSQQQAQLLFSSPNHNQNYSRDM